MKKIKIVTDSTAYITKEYAHSENITVVPLNYVFYEISYKEGFKGEFDEFFTKLGSTKLFPQTSQPSAGEFVDAFETAFENDYDEIVAILISSKLSGTYNSALLAKNILEDKSITIIDTLTSASNLRYLVEDAVKMVKEGKTSEEIKNFIDEKKNTMHVYLTADTLEYLSRGGRLSAIQSTVGNLLNIKPIIQLKDGVLGLLEKTRGKNKAIAGIIDKIPEDVSKIGVCHALNIDEATKLKDNLNEKFPMALITIDELGPVVGSHLGPKAIGVCFY
jgi:DegV family protein with EDD domain